MLVRLLVSWLIVVCVVALAGCNTVKGVGKDVSKTGEAIEKAATH